MGGNLREEERRKTRRRKERRRESQGGKEEEKDWRKMRQGGSLREKVDSQRGGENEEVMDKMRE